MSKIVEMHRLDSHPLAARFYDMSRVIEALGGSPELTAALNSFHDLRQEVEDELNRFATEAERRCCMTTALIQALSRLADNRQADGTSSLVSAEDRKTIIDGCYELMIAARQNSTPRELFGPYAHLNGHRALSEDSWLVEDDPIENNEEYFSIPLFAQVEVTFPVTHGAPDAEAYRAYADELGQDAIKPTRKSG